MSHTTARRAEANHVSTTPAVDSRAQLLRPLCPLQRARGLLMFRQRQRTCEQNYEQALSDIQFARRVFHANNLIQEHTECVELMGVYFQALGAMHCCATICSRALSSEPITAAYRVRLAVIAAVALCAVSEFEEADRMLNHQVLPWLPHVGCAKTATWAHVLVGHLRVAQYFRAMNEHGLCALDCAPCQLPDQAFAKSVLALAKSHEAKAGASTAHPSDQLGARFLTLAIISLSGYTEQARQLLLELAPQIPLLRPEAGAAMYLSHANVLQRLMRDGVCNCHLDLALQDALGRGAIGLGGMISYVQAHCHHASGGTGRAPYALRELLRTQVANQRLDRWLTDERDQAYFSPKLIGAQAKAHLHASRPRYLRQALSIIAGTTVEKMTPIRLAAQVNISRRSLENAMRQYEGQSPLQLIRRQRMLHAFKRLREDGVDIQRVALELGYSTREAFSRDFRKAMGMSPGMARKMNA